MDAPSGDSAPVLTKCLGGSQVVTVDSAVKSPMLQRTRPPSRGSISLRPMNHESKPGPVATASQTRSGGASTSMSRAISNSCAMLRSSGRS